MPEVYMSYGYPPGVRTVVYHCRADCSRIRAKPISWDLEYVRENFPRLRPCRVCHREADHAAEDR